MTFATALALLVGLLVTVPVIAHLLRRGKTEEQEFPPARLVPAMVVTSEQRSRLEDLLLLLLRATMIAALAILGATPFVQCSDLTVDRKEGASVALAIVVDDSQSMRARTEDGETRFELALEGAKQLLDSARDGDVIALISGGKPARLLLNATPDLTAARDALGLLQVTDRATDLSDAVALARAALSELPHVDKRVILLSDLSTRSLPKGDPVPWTPLPELRKPVDNCGISVAQAEARGVLTTVGCSSANAARGRKLEVHVASEEGREPLATVELQALLGIQKIDVRVDGLGLDLEVKLSGSDALPEDDAAAVVKEMTELLIAVAADPAKASAATGGPTIIVQALNALDPTLDVRPLGELPEAAGDLERFAALIVDDPAGLSPEERAALNTWLEAGGAALGLLGPSSTNTQLASSVEPFARKGAEWEAKSPVGIAAESIAWLGEESASLTSLAGGGRVRLDAADLPGSTIRGRWDDGVPWLFHRDVGRGLVWTVGLPASVEHSDFALRPGFLALLELVVQHARQTRGPKRSSAGTPWLFQGDQAVKIEGPKGLLKPTGTADGNARQQFIPELAGRYVVTSDGDSEGRLVVLDEDELVLPPQVADGGQRQANTAEANNSVDASPQWALMLLALFAAELLFRAYGDRIRQRFRRTPA